MKSLTGSRIALVLATSMLLVWTLLNTIMWPVDDYADAALAYAESTNQIVRGMSIGVAAYVASLAMIFGWNAGGHSAAPIQKA